MVIKVFTMKNTGIYIHIPFCVKKCNYCDFNSGPYSDEVKALYTDALLKELHIKAPFFKDSVIDTVFIGGGTPSILPVQLLGKIFESLRSDYDICENAEITIESNPGTLDLEKLKSYRSFGINRLSIGLQSTVDEELKILGRIHNFNDFLNSYDLARKAGFENINVDLMNSIPDQTYDSFIEGLKRIKELSPEHISVYSLILEEGTPFYDMKLNLPDEDTDREMVHSIIDVLKDYRQYEISNYTKTGFECRHNIKYWKRDDYQGFGVSAASLFDNDLRFKNTDDINEYIDFFNKDESILKDHYSNVFVSKNVNPDSDNIFSEFELLSEEDIISEYIILGLRMNEGIDLNLFEKAFNKSLFDLKSDKINLHISEGLLERKGDMIMLTERGRDLGNYVWADFLGD